MKVWFTEIGEPLPMEKDARLHRYGQLTQFLAARGHEVVWWTSNFSHAPKRVVCEGDKDYLIDGVRLRVISGRGYRRNISVGRFRHQSQFAKEFYRRASALTPPDLLVTPIPTIETAFLAVKYAREKNIPVCVDIRDEWPDDLINLAPPAVRGLARRALGSYVSRMTTLCHNATAILGVSERQLAHGLKYAGRARTAGDGVFPHGYAGHSVHSNPKLAEAHQWWKEQGLRADAFVVCFFGTLGKFFDIEPVIAAAKKLSVEMPIQFVICGDGGSLAKYRARAANVPGILFPGWVDSPKISALMQVADAGLAPYGHWAKSMSLPNKPFEYFSSGLPVISSIEQGELRSLLEQFKCGETYRSDDVDALCEILRRWAADPLGCEAMGTRGRKLLEDRFTTAAIFERLERHFMKMVTVYQHPIADSQTSRAPENF